VAPTGYVAVHGKWDIQVGGVGLTPLAPTTNVPVRTSRAGYVCDGSSRLRFPPIRRPLERELRGSSPATRPSYSRSPGDSFFAAAIARSIAVDAA
jgi:hypothetical protein